MGWLEERVTTVKPSTMSLNRAESFFGAGNQVPAGTGGSASGGAGGPPGGPPGAFEKKVILCLASSSSSSAGSDNSGSETELEELINIFPKKNLYQSLIASFYKAVKGGSVPQTPPRSNMTQVALQTPPPTLILPTPQWQCAADHNMKMGEDTGDVQNTKMGEDRGFDAFGPNILPHPTPLVRLAKTFGMKRISDLAETEQSNTQMDRANCAKRMFKSNNVVPRVAPHLIHPTYLFIMGAFVGPQNYRVMEKTSSEGVVFKRIVLLDDTIAHDWIITSDRQLFKIEGNSVVVKKAMARGLVNVTRTMRPSFVSLIRKNFPAMYGKDDGPC